MTCGPGSRDTAYPQNATNRCRPCWPRKHQFFLCQNLKLHLGAARLGHAVIRRCSADSLRVAMDWLGRYFETGDPPTATLRSAIEDAVTRHPSRTPDISQSLRALKVRQDLMDDIAPAGLESR